MADFDPTLHTPQDFDPTLHTPVAPVESGLTSSFLHGVGGELYGAFGKTLGLAGAGLAVVGDKARGMVTGRDDTTAQEWAFKNLVDPMTAGAARYAPTAEESQSIPLSVAHGLGGMAADLPLIALTGGKAGLSQAAGAAARIAHGVTAMAPVAVAHAASNAAEKIEQNVDLPTAFESGALSGLSTLAMGAVPLAMQGGLGVRAVTGAASGIAAGEASRVVQNAALGDYPELQTPFTPQSIATSAATGALLGSVMGPRPIKTQVAKAKGDAEDALNSPPGAPIKPIAPNMTIPEETPATTPPATQEEALARRNPEIGVFQGLDQIAEEVRAQKVAAAEQNARVQNATTPADLPVLEDVRAKSQAHADDIAQLRDAGIQPTGDPIQDRVLVFNTFEKPPAETEAAKPEPKTEQRTAEEEIAYAQKSVQDEQQAANAEALAKVNADPLATPMQVAMEAARAKIEQAKNEAQAKVDANKQVQDAYVASLQEVLPEGMAKSTKTAVENELRKLVDGKTTPEERTAALQAKVDSLEKTKPQRYEFFKSLLDNLTTKKEVIDETQPAETQAPEAIQAEEKGSAPPADVASEAAAPAEAVDPIQASADRLMAARAALNDKARTNEGLTDLEKTHQEDMAGVQKSLQDIQDKAKGNNKYSDNYVADITKFADELAAGKDNLPLIGGKAANPDARSLGMMEALAKSDNVNGVLDHISANASEPWVKDLADRYRALGLDTKVTLAGAHPDKYQGVYAPSDDRVTIYRGGENEHAVLHEISHAASSNAIIEAQSIDTPRNQREAKLKQAYDELEKIRTDALAKATADDHYGLTDAFEFQAELATSKPFQDFLKAQDMQKTSLWTRAIDAGRKLLGLPPEARNAYEKAVTLSQDFIGKQEYDAQKAQRAYQKQYDSSPAGAAKVIDTVLPFKVKSLEEMTDKFDWRRVPTAIYGQLMRAKNTMYIADRLRAIPEMVQHGMSQAVDAYEKTYQNEELVHGMAKAPVEKLMTGLAKIYKAVGNNDAVRELSKLQQTIGAGSSVRGFDFRMNYDDNVAAGRDLPTQSKDLVNDIYRKYRSLQSTNPQAAQAIVDGALVNRRNYVMTNATILSSLADRAIRNGTGSPADLALAGQFKPLLDIMGTDWKQVKNGDTKEHFDSASYELNQRIGQLFAAAKTLPEDSNLRAQVGAIEPIYTNLMANPYYSVGRTGNHFANIGFKDMDAPTWEKMQGALTGTSKILGDFTDQDHIFMKFDSPEEAAATYRKLTQAAGDKWVSETSASGLLAENGRIHNAAGISTALRSVLSDLQGITDAVPGLDGKQAGELRDALSRQLLQMLPETSTKLSTLKREGIPGYDGDFAKAFGQRASGAARDIAHIYSAPAYADVFQGMKDATESMARATALPDGTIDPHMADLQNRAQMARGEITQRYNDLMSPVDNTIVNQLNAFSHTMYLGAAPAFYIRTMAQPIHRGLPIVGSRYGFANGIREIMTGQKDGVRIITNSIQQAIKEGGSGLANAEFSFAGMGFNDKDTQFLEAARDRGILKLGQAQQLARLAMTGGQKMQDIVKMASMTAGYAEMTNRAAMGLAAFRLAEKGGAKTTDANIDYAIKVIKLSMDDFDQHNTARAFGAHGVAGPITPLMTQFINYSAQTIGQIARTVHDGWFNRDPSAEGMQRSKEAKKEFGGLMATTSMISGAMGLPFANAIAGVYNMLTNDPDSPSDIREDTRNFLANIFGEKGGEVAAHGVGTLMGVDTTSFGLADLLPGSGFLANRRLLKDKLADTSMDLMGPALNAGMDIAQGMNKISDGYYVKGIEQMLPVGLKGYWKAGEIAANGYTDSKGNPIGIAATPSDVAIQAVGLRPSDKAEQAEAQSYWTARSDRLANRRQLITGELYRGTLPGNNMDEALGDLKAYNAANPTQPIRDIAGAIRQRTVELALAQASGTGVNVMKQQFPAMQQHLNYARQPNSAMPQY